MPTPAGAARIQRLIAFPISIVLRLRFLSHPPLGSQPLKVLVQGFLLLVVLGQWPIRWTAHVVSFIFAFAHKRDLSMDR